LDPRMRMSSTFASGCSAVMFSAFPRTFFVQQLRRGNVSERAAALVDRFGVIYAHSAPHDPLFYAQLRAEKHFEFQLAEMAH
jgi:hypothetical protein